MDGSENIDLLYLSNKHLRGKYNQKQKNLENTKELIGDINFYRKRIFNTTKDLLRGKDIDNNVDVSFNHYARSLIKYFKFSDKHDILQEEYDNLKVKSKTISTPDFNLSEENQAMSRETKSHMKTIKDYIPITIKKKRVTKVNYPKKKDIDIKNPKFRIKGLVKEKSKQNICTKIPVENIVTSSKKNRVVNTNQKTKAEKTGKVGKTKPGKKTKTGKKINRVKINQKIKHTPEKNLIEEILGKK